MNDSETAMRTSADSVFIATIFLEVKAFLGGALNEFLVFVASDSELGIGWWEWPSNLKLPPTRTRTTM